MKVAEKTGIEKACAETDHFRIESNAHVRKERPLRSFL
jgi:hypothetical protein